MPEQNDNAKEFALEEYKLNPLSSAEAVSPKIFIDDSDEDILSLNTAKGDLENADLKVITEEPAIEQIESEDPIFKELSEPKLPELARENRARLQMQSPNRIHFYWSFKANPFQTLNRVVGNRTNYQLIIKLVNQATAREELFPADAEGSAWFDVEADATYQAEVGFYAVNRPFVRLMFSNALRTPRKNPSPRRDYSERFAVSADQFARVLDVSGYSQDAFEVALAGDDIEAADEATKTAFGQIFDEAAASDFDANQSSEWRYVLLALASGYRVETLRRQISPRLFAFLQTHGENLSREKAFAALQDNFGVAEGEFDEAEETFGATVFGASRINFPRALKRRPLPMKFAPLSSLR